MSKYLDIHLSNGNVSRETIYSIHDFPFDQIEKYNVCRKNRKAYINQLLTFDIESTTIECEKPYGFMYAWQMCIENRVLFGRTWQQFIAFIKALVIAQRVTPANKLVIWVHNLSYEFQFIKNFFEWDNVFAKDSHKVLRAETKDGVEFRCSYFLTNKSLYKFCSGAKNHLYCKKDGEKFDYKKIRTADTPLTNYENEYRFCDVRGLSEALEDLLIDDNLATIPMTSTGYVRRNCRNAMRKNPKNRKLFRKMQITKEVYLLLEDLKRGGNTHASRFLAGKILENIQNWDITSDYPFQMCTKLFPSSAFMRIGRINSREELHQYFEKYCCIFRCGFENIRIKNDQPVPYISYSKCLKYSNDCIVYNGRLLSGSAIQIALTEIDFKLIERMYDFDRIYITDFNIAQKAPLPRELVDEIILYFTRKTQLKGVDPYEYAKSKELLNAIFGMMFTNPVHESWELTDNMEWEKVVPDIEEALNKYFNSRNSFLPPQWGCYVTAYAREQLQEIIDITGRDTVYNDTDSNKCLGDYTKEVSKLNEKYQRQAEKVGAYATRPDGTIDYMGVFDHEKSYDRFRSWGAKKYAYEIDGGLHITVAGLNKEKGADYLKTHGGLESFSPPFLFPRGDSGRTVSYWNDEPGPYYINVNGCRMLTGSNVGIVETTYQLGVTEEFIDNLANEFRMLELLES